MRKLAWLMLLGCQSGAPGASVGEPEPSSLPAVKVTLPPPVTFAVSKIPESYPDQTLSIYGVRKKAAQNLDREVRIKATVIDVYTCPCPGGKVTDKCGCDLPHFWIADQPDDPKEKAMMVADMPFDDRGKKKKIDVKVGEEVVVTGTFAKQSNTGFASSEGLLIYKEHAPTNTQAAK